MNEWSLAVRNLLRNRRRSLSTLLALAIGLTAILLFSGFKANLGYTMLTAFVRVGGHLQVQHRDYYLYGSGNPAAYSIDNYSALLESIRTDPVLKPMLAVATPMLRFGGLAGNFEAGISRTVIGSGYVADDVNRMRKWNEFQVPMVRPTFPLAATTQDAAIVGIGVARVLQLCGQLQVADCQSPAAVVPPKPEKQGKASKPGKAGKAGKSDKQDMALPADIAALAEAEHAAAPKGNASQAARIELLSSSSRGAPNVAALNVVAAEDQGFKELDEVAIVLHLENAQRLVFGRGERRATALMLQLHRSTDQSAAARQVQKLIDAMPGKPPLVVHTVEALNPFYVQSETLFNMIFGFIFVLIAGIVLFTVGNTMNAAVVERTVEVGTLRAIGLRQQGIRRLFVMEGFMLGCFGAVTGIIFALVLGAIVNQSGMTWLPPGSSEKLPLQLRVPGEGVTVITTTLGLILTATLSAWWPAWRAAGLKIVEALRHA